MFKKYDPRLVKAIRSYKIRDICRLYKDKKLHAQTIRSWINSGKLKSFTDGKNILVYGGVLKKFLLDKNNQHKRKLEFKQFRCGKCKTISEPENHIIRSLSIGRRGCLLAKADCPCCGHKMERLYKRNLEQEIVECFNVEHNELMTLCNHTYSTSKTHIDKGVKTAPSESLKTASEDEKPDTLPATSKTNINEKQLSLF